MKLVIFDCDGVLIDSELIACTASAEALTAIGYEISCERVVERFTGMPTEVMYRIVESELGRTLPAGFDHHLKGMVLDKFRSELQAIDGAADVLASMETKKCVASSSNPAKLALGLIETGLFELLYPFVYSAALVERGKPHPDLFEYSANAMGVEPSDCLVVEDSVAGVTAARAAGMKSIGFVGGSHCPADQSDRLFEAGAVAVINNLKSLLQSRWL